MSAIAIKLRKQTKREIAAQQRRLAAAAKVAAKVVAAEEAAELLAPKVQREAVTGHDGRVIRGPRVEMDGISTRRSNPVRRLVALSKGKENPTYRKVHEDVADQLLASWEEGANGINAGCSNYGERAGGAIQTGMIADGVLAVLNQQMRARDEVLAVQAFLGALWPIVYAVVIRNIDVKTWAENVGMRQEMASGYFVASLDRLVEYYEPKKERRRGILSIEIGN